MESIDCYLLKELEITIRNVENIDKHNCFRYQSTFWVEMLAFIGLIDRTDLVGNKFVLFENQVF